MAAYCVTGIPLLSGLDACIFFGNCPSLIRGFYGFFIVEIYLVLLKFP
jgi:hypothetical protein